MTVFTGTGVTVVALAGVYIIAVIIFRFGLGTGRSQCPPGPEGLPFLGNALDIPKERQWETFNIWKERYGDIIGLSAIGKPMVVLNSRKVVQKLLVERGAIYSDRPPLTLMKERLGFDYVATLMSQGEEWSRQRKMMMQCMGPSPLRMYQNDMRQMVREMCLQIANQPNNWRSCLKLMVVKNIARIVYGFHVTDFEDEYVKLSESLTAAVEDLGTMGAHPIDFFPILSILPDWVWGINFSRKAAALRNYNLAIFREPYERAMKNIADGACHPNSMVEILSRGHEQSTAGERVKSIKAAAASLYGGGTETTSSSLASFVLLMVCNPEIQEKAARAVTTSLGSERLPDFPDRDLEGLVYIEALLMELYRWTAIMPLGLPHSMAKDDVYDGMHLKAGTTVLTNNWGCLHDPEVYPDPETFNPDRFLEPDPSTEGRTMRFMKNVPDPRSMAFGYGRRTCPGRYMAESVLWITVTTLLLIFEFSKAPHPTKKGEFIEPSMEFTSTVAVNAPKPFSCVIRIKSKAAFELLQTALEK